MVGLCIGITLLAIGMYLLFTKQKYSFFGAILIVGSTILVGISIAYIMIV